jgi:hypothetical protein
VRQLILSLMQSLTVHESFWLAQGAVAELQTWGVRPEPPAPPASADPQALADQARQDLRQLEPLLAQVLDAGRVQAVLSDIERPTPSLNDDLWASTVYAVAAAIRRGKISVEHVAALMVPLYFWRAAAFLAQTAGEPDEAVDARLAELASTFERLKPRLVEHWARAV